MTSQETQISSKFPESFGDFGVRSSDGIICYFPRSLLSLMSPVFQDMLTLGAGENQNTISIKPVVDITEPCKILELFLTHLDPRMNKPNIDKETIEDLLAMAHKYQASTIMEWFDEEAITKKIIYDTIVQEPFVTAEPVICFSLASRYELRRTRRYALKEVIGFNHQRLLADANRLGLAAYLEVAKARNARVKFYQNWIDALASPRTGNPGAWEKVQSGAPEFWVTSGWRKPCNICISQRVQWMLQLARAVELEPSWSAFIKAYENNSTHCFPWSEYYRDWLSGWKTQAEQEEAKIPEWPAAAT